MGPERDQHEADHGFDRLRYRFGNGAAEQDGGTRERKQGQRVAEPQVNPCLTMSPTWVRRAAILETAAM
jgi:hypothetical protein